MKATIYELLGLSRNSENETYVKYHNRLTDQDDVMWACKENIIYKLDQNIVYLDDEVEILDEPKEDKIEKIDVAWQNVFDEQAQQDFAKMTLNKINEIIDEVNKLI